MTNSYCVPSFLARNQNFFVLSLSLSLAIDTMNNNECKLRRQTCLIKCSLISITRQLFPERALNYEWKNMRVFIIDLLNVEKATQGTKKGFQVHFIISPLSKSERIKRNLLLIKMEMKLQKAFGK